MKKEIPIVTQSVWICFKKTIISYLLILSGQLFVYLPILTNKYLVPDDYYYLYASVTHSDKLIKLAVAQGRLFNIVTYYFFLFIKNIDEMWLARAVSLLGIFLAALCIFHTFRKYHENRFLAALFSLLITISPAFQEYASWAILYLAPWGVILSYSSYVSLEKALITEKWKKVSWSVVAIFLLVLAYNIFPASATFIAVFFTISLLYNTSKKAPQNTIYFLVISGLAALVHYLLYKTYLVSLNIPPLSRTEFINDPLDKLTWFFAEPALKALSIVFNSTRITIAFVVLFIVITGLTLHFIQSKRDIVTSWILLLLLVMFSYSSNLIVAENIANDRTLLAFAGVITIMAAIALKAYIKLIKDSTTSTKITYVILSILSILGIFYSSIHINKIIFPPTKALIELREHLANFDTQKHKRVALVYGNESEYRQALNNTFYPEMMNLILRNDRKLIEAVSVTVKPINYPNISTDYIIPLKELTPIQKTPNEISAKYAD